MIKILAILTIAACAAFFVPTAQAIVCFDPTEGFAKFIQQFGEEKIGGGDLGSDKQNKMLLLANPKTGTWTMMIVRNIDGFLCPMASGENFKLQTPEIEGQKI
tara:strand:+ start:414 stop:722 length:309 start_codon:yes stop_codon:yes gene_type:complete